MRFRSRVEREFHYRQHQRRPIIVGLGIGISPSIAQGEHYVAITFQRRGHQCSDSLFGIFGVCTRPGSEQSLYHFIVAVSGSYLKGCDI